MCLQHRGQEDEGLEDRHRRGLILCNRNLKGRGDGHSRLLEAEREGKKHCD